MKTGDKLKIVELVSHTREGKLQEVTEGEIQSIDKYKITIKRLVEGEFKSNTSYNIADFKDFNKKFYLWIDGEWKRIKIKINENTECDDVGRGKGGKYA